ncbi:DUF305 domain-containing protein [Nonomuraea endophytica]|uniref:DUF305 domain-containing protein n=1 Tax=Nonomuraea endophytica TaxID=714136 RepID=UPI0037CB6902
MQRPGLRPVQTAPRRRAHRELRAALTPTRPAPPPRGRSLPAKARTALAWSLLISSAALVAQCHTRSNRLAHHHDPTTQAANSTATQAGNGTAIQAGNGTANPPEAQPPDQPTPTPPPPGQPAPTSQPPSHPGDQLPGQPTSQLPGQPGSRPVGPLTTQPVGPSATQAVGPPGNRPVSPAEGQPTGQLAAAGFNATDIAWLQLMIAMDERALPLLRLGEERGHDPAVRRLAARMLVARQTELERLRAVLHRTGLPATNVHAGHDMPGMTTPAQLAALESASGPAFDRAFNARLREHVAQTAHLARSARLSGADPDTKDLAASTERGRAADLLVLEGKPRG